MTKFLKDNGVEGDPVDYKPSRNMKGVDASKVKERDSTPRPVLTNAKRDTHDDSFFHHIYGMNKMTMMCGTSPPTADELR